MISLLKGLFDTASGPWGVLARIGVVLVVVAAIGGAVWGGVAWLRADAFADGRAACRAEYEKAARAERDRQDRENEAARAEQRRRFENLMTMIEAKNDELEQLRALAEGASGDDVAAPVDLGPEHRNADGGIEMPSGAMDGAPCACPARAPRGISGDSMRTINRF